MKKALPFWYYPKVRVATKLHLVLSLIFLLLQSDNLHASNHGLSDELRLIHHEIGLLKHENQQQNVEISLLKRMVIDSNEEGDKSISQNPINQNSVHLSLNEERDGIISKRPARLLPLQLLFNRNCTTCSEPPPRFYGPPTNCSDLTRLGYTLNGFYLVKAASSNNSTKNPVSNETHIKTIFCAFKQEGAFNASLVEKRISPLKPEVVSSPSYVQLKLVRNENVINFRSQITTLIDKSSRVRIIIYSKIIANVGEGFNETSEAFEAPKPGVYKFIFKGKLMLRHPIATVVIYLKHNDKQVGEAKNIQSDDGKDLSVIEETLKLNRGEKVYLVLGKFLDNRLDEGQSSFSGFLIHEFDE